MGCDAADLANDGKEANQIVRLNPLINCRNIIERGARRKGPEPDGTACAGLRIRSVKAFETVLIKERFKLGR